MFTCHPQGVFTFVPRLMVKYKCQNTGWSKSLCAPDNYSTKNAKIQYFKQFQSRTMITELELVITDGVSVGLVSFLRPFSLQDLQIFLRLIFFSGVRWKTRCIWTIPTEIMMVNMAITECVRNVDHDILTTVFENTVQRVDKCLENVGGYFEH